MSIFCWQSPLGKMLVSEKNSALCRLDFLDRDKTAEKKAWLSAAKTIGKKGAFPEQNFSEPGIFETEALPSAFLRYCIEELEAYFAGDLRKFSIPLAPEGTEFQKKVWMELCRIPYGETICYEELAKAVGNEKACRAVGNANGKNPIPVIIPCHRVVAKNGSLGGYSGGLDIKIFLLSLEKDALR